MGLGVLMQVKCIGMGPSRTNLGLQQCTISQAYGVYGHHRQIVACDFGCKNNILRRLASFGCKMTVVPADCQAKIVMEVKPDGIFMAMDQYANGYNLCGDPHMCSMEQMPHVPCMMQQLHTNLGAWILAHASVTHQIDRLLRHDLHPAWQHMGGVATIWAGSKEFRTVCWMSTSSW